jgi:hypothetical protein
MNCWYESEFVDISKSKFFAEQIEYLGYCITRQGIQPICNKVEMKAILNIKVPKTRKELRQIRQFIGIVNYFMICGFAEVSF